MGRPISIWANLKTTLALGLLLWILILGALDITSIIDIAADCSTCVVFYNKLIDTVFPSALAAVQLPFLPIPIIAEPVVTLKIVVLPSR